MSGLSPLVMQLIGEGGSTVILAVALVFLRMQMRRLAREQTALRAEMVRALGEIAAAAKGNRDHAIARHRELVRRVRDIGGDVKLINGSVRELKVKSATHDAEIERLRDRDRR